jgi:hypothetical protein
VSATVAALEDAYNDAETVCQICGDELNDAGTYELVHHIRGKASPDELALGSFTRRKPDATLLRSHWNYIIKLFSARKDCLCCDGSKRAAPELCFAQTYASCIDQRRKRFFFALSAAMGFVVMGADCTNAYA